MVRFAVSVALLSLLCLAGWAQQQPDLGHLVFWPEPLSQPERRVDPAAHRDARSRSRLEARDPAERAKLAAAVERALDGIRAEEARTGERSTALIGELRSLAALYRELGDHDAEAAALEDAVRIARINFGLYSLDQVEAVESLAAARDARADRAQAEEQRRYLRELVARNGDDARAAAILRRLADSEMDAARRTLDVPAPVQVTLAVIAPPGEAPPHPRKPALDALYAARHDYAAAIETTVQRGGVDVEDLLALEDALVDTVYFEYAHPELYGPRSLYGLMNGTAPVETPLSATGTRILSRTLRGGIELGRPAVYVANARLALADWYLVFAQFDSAFTEYEAARDLLVERGVARETIDALLHPELPPRIPVLPAGVAGARREEPFRGFVEASVEFTRFGVVKRVQVSRTSADAPAGVEKSLRRYLAASRFRPRFVAGELPRSDRFDARFYFDY